MTSACRLLGHALVVEDTHANAATGQSWQSVSTYSLDAQTRHLVVTRVSASSAGRPYMATSMRIYERSGQ